MQLLCQEGCVLSRPVYVGEDYLTCQRGLCGIGLLQPLVGVVLLVTCRVAVREGGGVQNTHIRLNM
jgi:hypothetical protein